MTHTHTHRETFTRDKHQCLCWDSNPKSEQLSGPRPTR